MEELQQAGASTSGYYRKSRSHYDSLLNALLDDPLLADVPKNPSLADVDALLSMELGNAMRLSIVKMDASSFDVVVPNTATVRDLKAAIVKKINESEQEQLGYRHLSWKYVWGNFCLSFGNVKLLEDSSPLQEAGIRSNDQIRFENHLVSREAGRHCRAKKRRFFHGLRKE